MLSALFQQAQHLNKNEYTENQYCVDEIIPVIIKQCDLSIAAVERQNKGNGASELNEIDSGAKISFEFTNGIYSPWFINKHQFTEGDVYIENQSKEFSMPDILVLNIFSEYLRKQNLAVSAKNVIAFKSKKLKYISDQAVPTLIRHLLDGYIFAYQFPKAVEGSWKPDSFFEKDWMNSLARVIHYFMELECDKTDEGIKALEKIKQKNKGILDFEERWNSLVVIPAFSTYSKIQFPKLPKDTCPDELWNLGHLVVLPVTYADLRRFAEMTNQMPVGTKSINKKHPIIQIADLPAKDKDQNPLNIRINSLAKEFLQQSKSVSDIERVKLQYRNCLADFLSQFYLIIRDILNENEVEQTINKSSISMKELLHGCFLDKY